MHRRPARIPPARRACVAHAAPQRAVDAVPGRGWRLAIAGGIAGMISNSALHPLDTIKTVRQTNPAAFRGVLSTARQIVQTRGFIALYAGIAPALVGSALSSALYFGAYELAKRRLARLSPFQSMRHRVPIHAAAAMCGNIASSVLFIPKEVVKQRMQAGIDQAKFFATARNLVRTSGIAGLYRGYKATLLRNIPSTALRFVMFEECRRLIVARRGDADSKLAIAEFLLAGAFAGAFASACTMPMDVVKTNLSTGKLPQGTGVFAAIATIVRQRGVPALYVGILPRMMWSALGTGIGFGSYEFCKLLLRTESITSIPIAVRDRRHQASSKTR